MYDNIGRKIKDLAKAICLLEVFAAIIAGMIVIGNFADARDGTGMVGIGILIMVVGPLLAWISSWLLYGFGELIEKTSNIEIYLRPQSCKEPLEDRIKKLESLRSKGLITEEEYKEAISKIN